MTLAPSDVVDGRYKIERLLGRGGMGAVYVAEELELGRRVAIKVLLPEAAENPEAVARFEREGRAAAGLESEHVTRVFAVGRLANGAPYIVMELLDGKDLADTLEERGPLPVHEVVRVVVDACDALAEAHAKGIVHRDLKPANLFFANRANGSVIVKVLDFGISKTKCAGGAQSHALTGTSVMMGTPFYMSPEQIRESRDVDGRTDIWALGVTMYELLVGSLPFTRAALADLCVAVILDVHPSISAQRPDVPRALEAIVDRCLAKEAPARFGSATELADALRAFGTLATAPTERRHSPRASARPGPLPSSAREPNAERASLGAGLTINPVTTSQQRGWTPPPTPTASYGAAGVLTLLAVVVVGVFAFGKAVDKTAARTNGDASIALVAAPAVVSNAPISAASFPPLPPAPPHAPAGAHAPPKNATRSSPERSAAGPPRVQSPASRPAAHGSPPPITPTRPGPAPDGPPPINFERR